MAPLLTLVLLATFVRGQIEVRVTAGSSRADSSVDVSGSVVDVIRDHERDAFQLSDATLKDAIEWFHGARPDDVFLKSPTPWGDLYRIYGWKDVTKTIKPTQSYILHINTETLVLKSHTFVHNVSTSGSVSLTYKEPNSNSLTSIWGTRREVTTDNEFNYAISFKDLKGIGNKTIAVSKSYGEEITKELLAVVLGSEAAVKIPLKPYQTVRSELTVSRNTMRVQVEYEVFLSGTLAVNYAVPHLGHHFYGIDIGHIIFTDRASRRLSSSEVLTISYFTEVNAVIRDIDTGAVVFQFPLSVYTPENINKG